MGALAALRYVEVNGGQGQVIDLPLLDPLFAILGPQAANYQLTGKVKQRTGSRSTNSAPRNVYRTRDGKWVCLSASTQGMAERLLRAMDRAELIEDPRFVTNEARLRHVEELDSIIGSFIRTMDQKESIDFFVRACVTVGPVSDIADIYEDAHFHERDIVVELPDKETGATPVHNISPRLAETPGNFYRAAPELGEHTEEVLRELGYSDNAIGDFKTSGVVKTGKSA
jgi:crotonobetainyl-CoA:carnitine CoA-transferase CaiB-like acyl-CoA transferase